MLCVIFYVKSEMTEMNLFMRQKQTHTIENSLVVAKGRRVGWIRVRRLGLADASYIQNGQATRSC